MVSKYYISHTLVSWPTKYYWKTIKVYTLISLINLCHIRKGKSFYYYNWDFPCVTTVRGKSDFHNGNYWSRPHPHRVPVLIASLSPSRPRPRFRHSLIAIALPVVVNATLSLRSLLSCSRHRRHHRTLVELSLSDRPSCEPCHMTEREIDEERERKERGEERIHTREDIRERAHKTREGA
jgi:hypothetical protein